MYDILQSSTQAPLLFFLTQSSDHITGLTGATPTVTISKAGGAFASPAGAVSEIGNGWYKCAPNATDTNTLGPLALHATAASADPCDLIVANVVAYNPQSGTNLGLSGLPTANPGANGGLPTVDANNNIHGVQPGTGTGQINVASGKVPATLASTDVTGNVATDVQTIKTQAVTCAAPVTVSPFVGSTGAAVNGTNANTLSSHDPGATLASQTNITGGTITTVTNLTNAPTAGDFTAAMKTSLNNSTPAAITGAVGSVTAAVTLSAGDSPVARTGTAQAGGATSITLDAGASATTNAYAGCLVKITSGTGAGVQCRTITAYNGTTKVATVDYAWETNPDATSVFTVLYADNAALNASLQPTAAALAGQSFPANFAALGITAGGHIANVDTLTTYTGDTPQTGDAFARLGAPAGASVSADVAAVNAKTTNLPASPAAVGSAMTLTAGERDAIANDLLDLANGVETGKTLRQALRAIAAALAGKRSNAGTATEQYDALGNPGTARIVGNLDASGNGTPTLTL